MKENRFSQNEMEILRETKINSNSNIALQENAKMLTIRSVRSLNVVMS